jgi:hypothetical protein
MGGKSRNWRVASFPGATYALEKLVERLYRPESDDFNGLRIGIDCAVLGDESEDANVDGSLDLCRKAMVGDCLVSRRFQEVIGDLALFDDLGYMVVDDTRELRPVYRLRPKFMAARNIEFDPTLTGG